jgi:integrase
VSYKKIAPGIYRDDYSIRAVVNTSVGRKEKRFAHATNLLEVKRWRNEQIGRFALIRRKRPPIAGTLRADVRRYLSQIKHLASWKSRRSELDAWLEHFGTKARGRITVEMVRNVVAKWRTADGGRLTGRGKKKTRRPYGIRTCEHRVATLRHLFHVLDGFDVPTPCDEIKFDLPQTQPVFVPATVIMSVAERLKIYPDTRARFMVLAATGVRPAELMRAEEDDLNLESRIWIVRTGKGGKRPPLYLNDEMVAALEVFIAAEAWGPYDTSKHAKRLREAGWPKGVRPYAVRGTFGMELSRRGTDLADIQQVMGHTSEKTTRTYYVPPEDSRLAAATRGLTGRLGWKPAEKR